jgi:hAT family C-terminal dimerisation region
VVERVATNNIWKELEHRKALGHMELRPVIRARIEADQYIKHAPLPITSDASIKSDPLSWGQYRRTQYPQLFCLTKQHLVLMANTVPRERLFEKMELLITDRRCNLKTEKAAMIAMVASNLHCLTN